MFNTLPKAIAVYVYCLSSREVVEHYWAAGLKNVLHSDEIVLYSVVVAILKRCRENKVAMVYEHPRCSHLDDVSRHGRESVALEGSARYDLWQNKASSRKTCPAKVWYLDLRFHRTDTSLMTAASRPPTYSPRTPAAQEPEPGARKLVEGEKGCGAGNTGDEVCSYQYR